MSKSWESCMRKASQSSPSVSSFCGWMSFSVLGLWEELAACTVLSQRRGLIALLIVEICSQHVRSPLPHSPHHLSYIFLNLLFSKKVIIQTNLNLSIIFSLDFINFPCCLWWQSRPWPFVFSLWFWNNLEIIFEILLLITRSFFRKYLALYCLLGRNYIFSCKNSIWSHRSFSAQTLGIIKSAVWSFFPFPLPSLFSSLLTPTQLF